MRWILLATALLLVPNQALAWGDQGYHPTCQIAYGLLTPTAKAKVDKLLAGQQAKYRTSARACAHPDKVKSFDERRSWHFIKLPRNASGLPGLACPVADSAKARLLHAIETDSATLSDRSDSLEARRSARKAAATRLTPSISTNLRLSWSSSLNAMASGSPTVNRTLNPDYQP